MTKAKDGWAEANWPARVVGLHERATTGETEITLRIGLVDGVVLCLPADHEPPTLGEQLLVTLHRGAQP